MGGPRRTAREAVDALDEALDVIRAMWSGQRSVRTDGEHYRLGGAHPGPRPSAGLGIWLGAYGPRMLRLTGAKADGWLPSHAFLGLDRLGESSARIDGAARAAGGLPPPSARSTTSPDLITTRPEQDCIGPIDQWVDQLVEVTTEHGMNGYVFWPSEDHERPIRIFAERVVPGVRSALAG